LLLLAVGLVFAQTVHFGFVNYDDDRTIYWNPHVARGLSGPEVAWAFTHRHFGNWIPLTCLSHMLDSQLYGLNAGGHHLTNVLLHAATTVLLFLVLRQMTGQMWPSALAAALFALHPLRVESVAWVTERKDVLSGLFFVLALGAYTSYVHHPFSLVRYLAIMIFFALGLMAKPMLVTLPAVLLLLDYWPLGRFTGTSLSQPTPSQCNGTGTVGDADLLVSGTAIKPFSSPWRLVGEKLPLLLLVAVSCIVTLTQGSALAAGARYPLGWRMGNALIACVTYLIRFFCPTDLAALYPRLSLALPLWKVLAAFLVLASVTVAAWVWRRTRPYLLMGWLWYLGMLVPVIGLVQIGIQAVADRFTYLPQIGLGIALAWGAADLCRSSPRLRRLCGGASVLALALLMGCAWRQTAFWHDSEALWTHTLACTSRNSMAHTIFATGLAKWGRVEEALDHFRRAIEFQPDDAVPRCNVADILAKQGRLDEAMASYRDVLKIQPGCVTAHNNLGQLLARQGRLDEAAEQYRRALQIQPDLAVAYWNLGNVLLARGRLAEAESQYRKALEIAPDYAMARNNLGHALAKQGRLDEAIAQYQKALEIAPDYAETHDNLGAAFVRLGRFDAALPQFQKALQIQPDYVEARKNLAWLRATCPQASLRNGAEAIEHARRADQLCGNTRPDVLDALAAAYAEAGRFPDALATARKALELAVQQKKRALADALRTRIALYEAGKPYHEAPSASPPSPSKP
jgi:tetratricopeptide (TPR) repeat protein